MHRLQKWGWNITSGRTRWWCTCHHRLLGRLRIGQYPTGFVSIPVHTDLTRVSIRRVCIYHSVAAGSGGVLIFLVWRGRGRRGARWRYMLWHGLCRNRCREGRKHGHVAFATVRPHGGCRDIHSRCSGLRTHSCLLILDASATLAFLNGLKSSLTCTGDPFLRIRVPKNGLGVVGV